MGMKWVRSLLLLFTLSIAHVALADDPTSFTFTRLKSQPKEFSAEFITALGTLQETTANGADKSDWQARIDQLMTSAYIKKTIVQAGFKKQVDQPAIDRAYDFVIAHEKDFDDEEKKYKIPRAAIGALFWIETRLGTYTGSHPVVEVFFGLAGCDHPARVAAVLKAIRAKPEAFEDSVTKLSDSALTQKILARARKKVTWALGELRALDLLYREDLKLGSRSTRNVFGWKGSYAGAFGIGQFLPSTYRTTAVSDTRVQPDLFDARDAILSTGHFLSAQWGGKTSSQTGALMNYNPLKAYGQAILDIAQGIEKKQREAVVLTDGTSG